MARKAKQMGLVDSEAEELSPAIESDEAVGSQNDERVAMLERINDANDGLRAEEMVDVNDDGTTTDFVAQPIEQEEVVEEPAPVVEDELEAIPVIPKHKLKVNGREVEMTTEELIARAQKVEAADQYLIEAARIKREAEQGLVTKQEQDSHSQKTAAENQRLEERRALVRAIQMGTEEEAMAALDQMQSLSRQPQLTQEQLARTVDERLTFKEAVSRFETQYQDILNDPVLRDLALKRDQELLQQGDKRDYWTRYKDVGDTLRSWRDGLLKSAQEKPEPGAEKQSRKAAIPNSVPRAAGAKAPPATVEDDKEESVSDVIAAIAKSRGGPQWARN